MSEVIFYTFIWWVIGFIPFFGLIINDYYKGSKLEIYHIWKALGFSFLGPFMFIVMMSYVISEQGWYIQRKRK